VIQPFAQTQRLELLLGILSRLAQGQALKLKREAHIFKRTQVRDEQELLKNERYLFGSKCRELRLFKSVDRKSSPVNTP
jgi:hypothetical protein